MPISADILSRRTTRFVLWAPATQSQAPQLVIGQLVPGNPPTLQNPKRVPLAQVGGTTGLWDVAGSACGLVDGHVYHYWIEVDDSRSSANPPARISVTDPFAFSVDWRIYPLGATDNTQPASVIKFTGGQLIDCDPSGDVAQLAADVSMDTLPPNNQLVIYELPTAWAMSRALNEPERAVATFLDAAALVDENLGGANFSELSILAEGKSYLSELGVNALELLPPADSFYKREWGYDTSHYLAPDSELGFPEGNLSPTANRDLATLVASCHEHGIRFFIDVVMAFAHEDGYNHIDAGNFHIDSPKDTPNDPDAKTSFRADGSNDLRNGFGSTLWRYAKFVATYDPLTGQNQSLSPARQLMLTYLTRWMRDFHVDGVRMDSVENVASWDFVGDFKNLGRKLWNQRWQDAGLGGGADERFIVVGEELSLPFALLSQGRLDGLWNEDFQSRIRAAVLGENVGGEPTFEWTVRKAIDCRLRGFTDGAQAINYVTKHDVEGYRHERLYTMLRHFPQEQIERRIKLAFVCLLTAVGIPMVLAGEEFADQHDLFDENGNVTQNGGKQVDPVNFGRLTAKASTDQNDRDGFNAEMRRRVFQYVKDLIRFRTSAPALSVNDTDFIHVDFDAGKRVLVWKRGSANVDPVVVVANFSDFGSGFGNEYVVHNWPATPAGKKWIDVSQGGRIVDPNWVGRESIFPWEAKVYTLA